MSKALADPRGAFSLIGQPIISYSMSSSSPSNLIVPALIFFRDFSEQDWNFNMSLSDWKIQRTGKHHQLNSHRLGRGLVRRPSKRDGTL